MSNDRKAQDGSEKHHWQVMGSVATPTERWPDRRQAQVEAAREREAFDEAFFKTKGGKGLKEFCWAIWQARAALASASPAPAASEPVLWLTQKEFDVLNKQPKGERETVPLYATPQPPAASSDALDAARMRIAELEGTLKTVLGLLDKELSK
jgi:hypothetical protein